MLHLEYVARFGVDAFVTTRFGGVSAAPYDSLNLAHHVGDRPGDVAENRRRVARAAGVEVERLVTVRQVHGGAVIDARAASAATEGDAIVTHDPTVAVAVLVADCLPVLLVDRGGPGIAVVHAGWRGLDAGVLGAAVASFPEPDRLVAVVGPGISPAAYQVGPEVAARFADSPGAVLPDVGDRSRLDLRRIARAQLVGAGLEEMSVFWVTPVTDGGVTFYSDRAARPCGRFGLVARRPLA